MIERKYAKDLTTEELRSCYAMSFKSEGDLMDWLYHARHAETKDRVLLYKEDSQILGWAMKLAHTGDVGFWVKTTHRRKGIGTSLLKATQRGKPIKVKPHDTVSINFFNKNNVTRLNTNVQRLP